jgi:tRNA dimethylallyltransferase
MIGFLRNKYNWESSIDLIKRDTWQYAKRQMTWFAADKEINWFACDSLEEIRKEVRIFWEDNNFA